MTVENYIFDLDGTLIDSCEEIILCIKEACRGFVDDLSVIDDIAVGSPIKNMLENIVKDEKALNEIIKRFRKIYDNKTDDNSKLFEGVSDMLKILKNKQKSVFILTNKPSKPALRIIRKLGLEQYFEKIYTIDCFNENYKNKSERLKFIIEKHALNPSQTVYTGDSIEDIIAAKANNITSIAALWGYEKNKNLLSELADFWLEKLNSENFDELTTKLNYLSQK